MFSNPTFWHRCVEVDGRQQGNARIDPDRGRFSNFGRMVAYSEVILSNDDLRAAAKCM